MSMEVIFNETSLAIEDFGEDTEVLFFYTWLSMLAISKLQQKGSVEKLFQ